VDRCALFVDAGYLLADGAMAVHGTHRRESVTWDYPGLLQLLANLAMERTRMPLLRCYWYDSTVEGRRTPDHDALADLPGVKLRLAKMRPGRREGVEGEIHRDLTTLARNKAVSDAMVVTGEEDLADVIADVQDMGMRVTLLHISSDGNSEIPRALRQECDDIVEINVAQLRPYAELISGAEPPRQGEREGGMLALRAGSSGSSGSPGSAGSNGNGRDHAHVLAGSGRSGGSGGSGGSAGQHAATPAYPAAGADQYQQAAAQLRSPRGEELIGGREDAQRAEAPPAPEFTPRESGRADRTDRDERGDRADRADGAAEYAPVEDYGTMADYGAASDYRAPLGDYGAAPDYGPSFPDFTPAASAPAAPAASAGSSVPDYASRAGAGSDFAGRPGAGARAELPEYPAMAARDEVYGAPVAVPAAAEDLLPAERSSGRQRPDADSLRPVESGYSPGGARDQFQLETGMREPVPAGAAQVRRLPSRGAGQPGHAASQPSLGQPSQGQPSLGQPVQSPPGAGVPAVPGGMDPGGGSSGSGGQPIAPVVPMEQAGLGYGGNRGAPYGGSRPANGPVSPVSLVGQPSGAPGPSVHADPAGPGNGSVGQPGQGSHNGLGGQNGHNGQVGQLGQLGQGGGQNGQQEPGAHPVLSPVVVAPPAGYQDAGGSAGYSGGQSGVSLADAVQSAHEEGQAFGESVARDAPALWLEAVLARKPRMPSDLEARLLQGSALPIDFLLHDEVRHALRRGFWDALERARR
jgi:uncharacterized LabA/DUF88 family protein